MVIPHHLVILNCHEYHKSYPAISRAGFLKKNGANQCVELAQCEEGPGYEASVCMCMCVCVWWG